MRQDKLMERNRSIMQALSDGEPRTEVARRFNLSYSQTFRAEKAAQRISTFAVNDTGSAGLDTAADNTAPVNLMQQIGATGLKRYGGVVDDEYERALKTLTKRVALFREMGDDPNVAAMLQATKMTLRRVSWYAETDGVTDVDKQAKDFLQSCLDDMSSSFTDVVDQALGMLQYGFAPAELVYKKRMGQDPGCCMVTDPATGAEAEFQLAHSKYDDGRIGWRKWLFMAPESLSPGSEWEFDESGGIQGINQTPPPSYQARFIPIDKAVLFRTTAEKNNPEGRSVLRAMWPAYYMYRNLQEIEAISDERMGAGFPVFYLGSDVPKDPNNPASDMYQFKNIVRNVRVDEQMGLVVPYAKMGGGAAEGKGVLFELVSPPSRGVVDMNQVITRYEQRAMMVGLAQFVHLGMNSVGARALGETSLDFFTLAVSAWADSLADTINRFAVDRLMRLNYFEGLTVNPHIAHESVMRNGLAEVATYINTLMQAQVLTPGPELEKYVRELADLPPKPETVDMTGNDAGAGDVAQTGDTPGDAPVGDNPQVGGALPSDSGANIGGGTFNAGESFADVRGAGKPGAKSTQINAVNDYQRQLERAYSDWSADCADALAGTADDEARRRLLEDDYLPLLFTRLNTVARTTLPDAVDLGLDGRAPDAAVYQALADAMDANSAYLSGTFIPAVQAKLEAALMDGDVAAALGSGAGAAALGGVMATMQARVSGQAGTFWTLYNRTITETAKGTGETVTAYLDPRAKHCDECPQFASEGGKEYANIQDYLDATGNRMPGEFACFGGCRCELKYAGTTQKREAAVFDYNPDQPRGDDGKWGDGGQR